MPWPKEEIAIDETLIRTMLEEQHNDLSDLKLVRVGIGFDNEVWRLGDDLVLRLPRHSHGARLLMNERHWLSEVTKGLPLRVPEIIRVSEASSMFPWPWLILSWLPGTTADTGRLRNGPEAARMMAEFLRAFHQKAPSDAPYNEFRGVALEQRTKVINERLAALDDSIDHEAIRALWQQAMMAPQWRSDNVWLHGDLHPGNILLERGSPTGVVDFGDLCQGDPATDIGAVLMLLPSASWPDLFEMYGSSDPALTIRAVGWATLFGVFFTELGIAGRASYEVIGRATIANALAFAAQDS